MLLQGFQQGPPLIRENAFLRQDTVWVPCKALLAPCDGLRTPEQNNLGPPMENRHSPIT